MRWITVVIELEEISDKNFQPPKNPNSLIASHSFALKELDSNDYKITWSSSTDATLQPDMRKTGLLITETGSTHSPIIIVIIRVLMHQVNYANFTICHLRWNGPITLLSSGEKSRRNWHGLFCQAAQEIVEQGGKFDLVVVFIYLMNLFLRTQSLVTWYRCAGLSWNVKSCTALIFCLIFERVSILPQMCLHWQ